MDESAEAQENTLALRGDHITLAHAAKTAGLADSGGQAKHLIREGMFRVNGVVQNMPEFQKAFSCKAGQPMVKNSACRVW